MKVVLIVVSAFKPAMVADMQRARQLAWTMEEFGWQVEVLAPHPSEVRPDIIDDTSDGFFREDVPIFFFRSRMKWLWRLLGVKSLTWRTLVPLYRAGSRLLRSRRFDLIYFSTTSFPYFALGPVWKARFKIPFIVDYHDPWCPLQPRRLRASVKLRISVFAGRHLERSVISAAAGVVSVSPSYLRVLSERYGKKEPACLKKERAAVIPFGVLPQDFARIRSGTHPDGMPQRNHIVYVGAGGDVMRTSFMFLCRVLSQLNEIGDVSIGSFLVELFGTEAGWREGDPCTLSEIAARQGLSELVYEDPRRVSYGRSLELLMGAHGALILGVDDEGYIPSKLFSYSWSGKPLLAVVRRYSFAYHIFEANPRLGDVLWFDDGGGMEMSDAVLVAKKFLLAVKEGLVTDRLTEIRPYTAASMAGKHAALFDRCSLSAGVSRGA